MWIVSIHLDEEPLHRRWWIGLELLHAILERLERHVLVHRPIGTAARREQRERHQPRHGTLRAGRTPRS